MQQIDRYAVIVALLRRYPEGRSTEEIAAGLELDRETVWNDLQTLSGWDVPLCSEPLGDKEVNWFLIGDSTLPALRFTESETLALLEMLQNEHSEPSRKIRADLQKTLLTEEQVSLRQIIKGRLLLKGPRPFCTSQELGGKVMNLEKAVLADSRLLIKYRKSGEPGETIRLNAYGMVYHWIWGFWYLYGKDQDGVEHIFRVDRIEQYEIIGHFPYPAGFTMEERFADAWGVNFSDPVVEVRIRFQDDFEVIPRVMRETAHRKKRNIEAVPGGIIYTDQVSGTTEIRPWIRSFGSSAIVLAPEELRENMIQSAWKVYRLYGEKDEKKEIGTGKDQ